MKGDYQSWQAALSDATGYDNPAILQKTKEATFKVKNGEAVYERDSVLFDEIQYSWPLLAGLMWVAAIHKGSFNVLDFGGSLGSTYYQNRLFLSKLEVVAWNVIEQDNYVTVGKQFFEDSRLKFYKSIEECIRETSPNVAVCSSSLQYVEQPYQILAELCEAGIDCVIIDRTPFHDGVTDRLCIQHVPKEIYAASYPSWIFSHSAFSARAAGLGFEIPVEFENPDRLLGSFDFRYMGMIFVRKNSSQSRLG